MRRSRHHLIGNPIRLPLIHIPGITDLKFGLQSEMLSLSTLLAPILHSGTTAGTLALQRRRALDQSLYFTIADRSLQVGNRVNG